MSEQKNELVFRPIVEFIIGELQREMSIPSKLLEHVAFRMMKSLFERFKEIKIIKLSILKENPPIVATECAGCGVEIELSRAEMDNYSVF